MQGDHFPEATVRHYLDGQLLHQANRYDNAMCHYAFSAECAIKAFSEQLQKHVKHTHNVEEILESLQSYHELLGILHPKLSLLIGIGEPPSVLFDKHPKRRYGNDVSYTAAELEACKEFASRLEEQVIAAAIDGKLPYESERGAL